MPLDLSRLVANAAYREKVLGVLERSPRPELQAAVARLREELARHPGIELADAD